MANTAKDTHSPPPSPSHEGGDKSQDREAARAERKAKMEAAPPTLNEQMQRSLEIETMGVTEWQRTQDQRPPEEQPVLVKDALPIGDVLNTPPSASKQVPGVSHPTTPLPDRAPVRDHEGNIKR